jgi:hypothetical protein
MRKKIFVGSSNADRALAEQVSAHLSRQPDVEGICWTTAFPVGLLTFEALERMLRACSGAVFIVSPEADGGPNHNVLIEFGLVAGRMGRPNVALCKSGGVVLPSDLLAVTVVELDGAPLDTSPGGARLAMWTTTLAASIDGVPPTETLHGYSGRWAFFLECDTWRRLRIRDRDIATLQGTVCLVIPLGGQGGNGIAEATMVLHLEGKSDDASRKPYDAKFHMCAAITEVSCRDDGSMHFRSQTVARQRVQHVGEPWPEEGLSEDDVGPWTFRWELEPAPDEPGQMVLRFETDFEQWSSGRGRARKE